MNHLKSMELQEGYSVALFSSWKLIFSVVWPSLFALGSIFVDLVEEECLMLSFKMSEIQAVISTASELIAVQSCLCLLYVGQKDSLYI